MDRLARWGNRHAFLTSTGLFLVLLLVMGGALRHEAAVRREEIAAAANERAAQLADEAKARAEAVRLSGIETCERAVRAVTAQSKADDQAIIDVIKQRFAETGRPIPPIYLALEATVANRQPPVGACQPNP